MSLQDAWLSREHVARGDPAHAELLEAVAEELGEGLGGVAVAGVAGIHDRSDFCLGAAGLVDDAQLRRGRVSASRPRT
jgi:hypothetical protein